MNQRRYLVRLEKCFEFCEASLCPREHALQLWMRSLGSYGHEGIDPIPQLIGAMFPVDELHEQR